MAERESIATLNRLIATCRDGEQGFRRASDRLTFPPVKTQFNDFARERAAFADELKQEVRKLGGEPDDGGSASGALHRGWMDVKEAVTGGDDVAIITEAERGEDVAVATYREALEQSLPASTHAIVERQYRRVKEVHDQVRALETARKPTHA